MTSKNNTNKTNGLNPSELYASQCVCDLCGPVIDDDDEPAIESINSPRLECPRELSDAKVRAVGTYMPAKHEGGGVPVVAGIALDADLSSVYSHGRIPSSFYSHGYGRYLPASTANSGVVGTWTGRSQDV